MKKLVFTSDMFGGDNGKIKWGLQLEGDKTMAALNAQMHYDRWLTNLLADLQTSSGMPVFQKEPFKELLADTLNSQPFKGIIEDFKNKYQREEDDLN